MSDLRATYRLQLTAGFGFAHARALVPYLRDLGISHLYLSPSLQARSGSTHGYDVIDPSRLSQALGGSDEFERLAGATRNAGMGIVLDVVPNHMAASDENRFWADPELRSKFFDVDPVTGRWRRFFDIDELAGNRQEDPEVFEATHELVLSLVRDGLVDGLRVDHPDGLADPAGYLERLRSRGAKRVWVEKILDPGERLRGWPVSGTVGYEFLNDACALFVDPDAEAPLTDLWVSVSGDARSFGEVAHEAKLEQVRGTFAPEVERLLRAVQDRGGGESVQDRGGGEPRQDRGGGESVQDRGGGESVQDQFDRITLETSLAALPVYRTYVNPETGAVAEEDRSALRGLDPALAAAILLETSAPAEFVTRFQQTTPAIMAKGVEDTAFYRYGRLLALNDVGGDPSRFGIHVDRFHAANVERSTRFPLGLLTTQTHDAKRSADVRSRIAVLSWLPEEWAQHAERWLQIGDGAAPDPVERYFLLQTLVGAWPIEIDRIEAYMEKALREAKRNTNWLEPDTDWEDAVKRHCRSLVSDPAFRDDFDPFVERVAVLGQRVVLGQLVLKLTVPGVPDIYQADELAFRALVDPDNRRPVDWDYHQAMLRRLMGGSPPSADTMKLFVTLRLLGLRARRPDVFAGGAYEPSDAGSDCCAFTRAGQVLVAVATRPSPQGNLTAPDGRWRQVLTGEEHTFNRREPVDRLLGEQGFAVFERL